jgi:hypothetical protein
MTRISLRSETQEAPRHPHTRFLGADTEELAGHDGSENIVYVDQRKAAVKDYHRTGLFGSNTNIDAAIVEAQAAAKTWGKKLLLHRGQHRIAQSISYNYATSADGDKTNTSFEGENESRDIVGTEGTILIWDGDATDPMFDVKSRGVKVKGVHFEVAAGKTCAAAISIDKGTAGGGTRCIVETVSIYGSVLAHGGVGGRFTNGIIIGPTADVNNLEFNVVHDTQIRGCSNACIKVASDTGQSKFNTFLDVHMSYSKHGVEMIEGSFHAFECRARDLEVVFQLGTPSDPIIIQGLDSELSDRIIRGVVGGSNRWPVSLRDARIAFPISPGTASDGTHNTWIELAARVMLELDNVAIDSYGNDTTDPASWKVAIHSDEGVVTAKNCVFASGNPFKSRNGGPSVIYAKTDNCYNRTYTGVGPWVASGFARIRDGAWRMPANTVVLPPYAYADWPDEGLAIPNTAAAPTVGLSGHVKLYSEAGVLKYIDDSNVVHVIDTTP